MTTRTTTRIAVLLLAASVLAASGCYKRVVKSRGFGASSTQTYEGTANIPKNTKKSNTAHNRSADWNY